MTVLRQKPGPSDAHDAFAGVVYAHGGCFAEGDCESFEELGRGFARRGLMVLDTSFRQGARNPHPGALRDLGDVAAWAHEAFPDLAWGVSGLVLRRVLRAGPGRGPVSLGLRDGFFIYAGAVSGRGPPGARELSPCCD